MNNRSHVEVGNKQSKSIVKIVKDSMIGNKVKFILTIIPTTDFDKNSISTFDLVKPFTKLRPGHLKLVSI